MRLEEENKSIEFSVLDYQFPDLEDDADEYDANWLTVQVVYTEGGADMTFTDSCILSWEIGSFLSELTKVIDGEIDSCCSEFMEPYLSFSVQRIGDRFEFEMRFICDVENDEAGVICVTQICDETELRDIYEDLSEFDDEFPHRR